jgi:phosphoglycerate kinase
MKSLSEAPIKQGTRVLVRIDMDVPLENGKILETFRLDNVIHTLKYIVNAGGFPVIAGHIDKPDGKFDEAMSTKHLLPYFVENLGMGNFELLENLRFDPREEKNDPGFAKELAGKAELYVNESFATSHRKHASIVGVPKHLPSFMGLRLEEEIKTLSSILEIGKNKESPMRPLVAVIGGAKLESKKPVISKFLEMADNVLVGGKIGLDWKEATPENLHLPTDYAEDEKDIGEKTAEEFVGIIMNASTVVWAGPMGMYENPDFIKGTGEIAHAMIETTATTIIGGGDTIAALNKIGMLDEIDFVSSGGGAMLAFLANENLPGIEALE